MGGGVCRYVAQRAGRHLEDELAFTTHKIEQNFSNYSAWHYRTSLLPLLHQPAAAAATAAAAASPRRFHADLPPAPAPDHPVRVLLRTRRSRAAAGVSGQHALVQV